MRAVGAMAIAAAAGQHRLHKRYGLQSLFCGRSHQLLRNSPQTLRRFLIAGQLMTGLSDATLTVERACTGTGGCTRIMSTREAGASEGESEAREQD